MKSKITALRKRLKAQPIWLRVLRALFCIVAGAYLINAVVINSFAASYTAHNEYDIQHAHGHDDHMGVDSLSVGGVAIPFTTVVGYVDLMDSEEVVYMNYSAFQSNSLNFTNILTHEKMHIYQKKIIAEASGGYPTYDNPIQTAIYLSNLLRLNNDLVELMPELNYEGATLASGLEAVADCYATPRDGTPEYPAFYRPVYLGSNFCSSEQIEIADRMADGVWPKPLTEEEQIALTPLDLFTYVYEVDENGHKTAVMVNSNNSDMPKDVILKKLLPLKRK